MALDPALDKDWLDSFPAAPNSHPEMQDTCLMEEPTGVEGDFDVDADTLLKSVQNRWGVPASTDAHPSFIPTVWERCDGESPEGDEDIPPYEKCYQGM